MDAAGIVIDDNGFSDTDESMITFTIDGVSFKAEKDMTWEEWAYSTYNTDGCSYYDAELGDYTEGKYTFMAGTLVHSEKSGVLSNPDSTMILVEETIIGGTAYVFS